MADDDFSFDFENSLEPLQAAQQVKQSQLFTSA